MPDLAATELGRLYTQRCNELSDINEHLPTLQRMTLHLKARKVIELGVRHGVSTVAWLYGLEQTGGHLWSVDPGTPPSFPSNRWTFVQGDDLDPNILAQLPELVDVVFIDTDHHFAQTVAELNTYAPRVRPGGRIMLHDTRLETLEERSADDPPFPVNVAIRRFCRAHGYSWTEWRNNNGLASIQVPE